MRLSLALAATAAVSALATSLAVAVPAHAQTTGSSATDDHEVREQQLSRASTATPLQSGSMEHLTSRAGQVGISGCFLQSAALFVTSGLDQVQVFDVSTPEDPELVGRLVNPLFENEAMNCGERRTAAGTERFALIGVDLVQTSPDGIDHTNVGGNELIVVDVTDPTDPTIRSRTASETSTHTVACVDDRQCRFAYSAGDSNGGFSVFDLRDLDAPHEVDAKPGEAGLQPFTSPTAGHKWNFDAAGVGTHTGWDGASMWSTRRPARPELLTTTGKVGRGEHPDYPGWNDFILHNSFRPNAQRFKPDAKPSFRNGNILLVTEEDYEQTDCSRAGSFQTWWVKQLRGNAGIKPLDKVELADLGSFPSPQGAFCSSHWFDFRPGGLVAVGFYGGGTQVLDVRNPRQIAPHGHSVWGASEVWDAMWVPVYTDQGMQTRRKTRVLYSIDLVRGLDVYRVARPDEEIAERDSGALSRSRQAILPVGLVGGALGFSAVMARLRRRTARPQ